jgi:TetR/AcrR family transcriptional regulator
MYESLIDFVEDTLFTRITQILNEEAKQLARCKKILTLYLIFCERNPGITRILSGDALMGEHERLRERVSQVYDRIETQLRQCLRMAEMEEGWRTAIPVNPAANMLLATAEGRIAQFVRSNFAQSPTEGWDDQWMIVTSAIGIEVPKGG